MIHLTIQQLSGSLDREMNEASESNLREHLSNCADCASRLERLEDQEEKLIRLLRSDPGGSVFERIERDVDERTRPGARGSAVRPEARGSSSRAPAHGAFPRQAAHAPSPAPVSQTLPPRAVERESDPERRPSSFPWGVVILVVAAMAGIGALNLGFELVPRWLGASAAKDRVLPAVADVVPAASDATAGVAPATNGEPRPEPAPVEAGLLAEPPLMEPAQVQLAPPQLAPPQREATQSEPARREPAPREPPRRQSGQAIVAEGDSPVVVDFGTPRAVDEAGLQGPRTQAHQSASEYEASADGWEQVLEMLHGEEYRQGRLRLAEARYHAWRLEPSIQRAERAAAALRAYMTVAPQGPDRRNATRWLQEIEEGPFR
jgi:hypothetical protein